MAIANPEQMLDTQLRAYAQLSAINQYKTSTLADVLKACEGHGLNPLMAAGPALRRECRHALVAVLDERADAVRLIARRNED